MTDKTKETKNTAKKRGRPPKKKVEDMSQTHGKDDKNFTATSLDQIWGDDGKSKYNTLDEEKYVKGVKEMSKTDLQAHAAQIGLIPIDNRENLEKRLIREFKRHVSSYQAPTDLMKSNNPTSVSKKAQNILGEGK
jgi:hypothetical protein